MTDHTPAVVEDSTNLRRADRTRQGRPTVLTDRVLDAYAQAIHSGGTKAEAAHVVGIHHSTVRMWAARVATATQQSVAEAIEQSYDPDWPIPEDGSEPTIARLIEFFAAAERAEAEAIIDRLARIRRHGQDDWRADAWHLERRYPDRFGRQTRIEHSGDSDRPVRVKVTFDGIEDRADEPVDVEAFEVDAADPGD